MRTKYLFPLIAFSLVMIMGITFTVNPSYSKSIEAKYYFEIGEYDQAYALASEAFGLDIYNRMAATIMAQSKTSLKYVKYIDQAKSYLKEINEIATHDSLTPSDRAKIKLMSEIVVDGYVKLAPSVITDKALVEEAAKYYNKFEKLLAKVTL